MQKKTQSDEPKNLCGQRIREVRKGKGMKIVDLMAALAVDYGIKIDTSALARLERQERLITDKELLAISEILEVELRWLLKGT